MKSKRTYLIGIISILIAIVIAFLGHDNKRVFEPTSPITTSSSVTMPLTNSGFKYEDVPDYSGSPYCEMNNNVPYFIDDDYSFDAICKTYKVKHKSDEIVSFERYGELDNLGRCTACIASVGKDLMPTEKRGDISSVHPTGWDDNTYRIKNRCHIIGFQLAGENDNEKNLFTGTRYLNVDGMLPFENEVADYVEETGNHVLYRVTPIFLENELMARGVLMEGYSIEDNGKGVSFCIYCYNVQKGYSIDYSTGVEVFLGKNAAINNNILAKAS